MGQIKFSIITVVYNGAKTIERTIKSIISQNYDNLEYIVIDGGSTDGTLEIINRYSQYVSELVSEPDEGIYDAMNKGISLATGDVIAFLNSDDWYADGALQHVAEQFNKEKQVQILFSNVYLVYENKFRIPNKTKITDGDHINSVFYHPGTFARRELFEQFGKFDLQYKIAADTDWILRILDHKPNIRCVDFPTTFFSMTGISNTEDKLAMIEAEKCYIAHTDSEEIKNYIHNHFAMIGKRIDFRKMIKNDEVILDTEWRNRLFNSVLFGSGRIGEVCYQLLQNNDIPISEVVDNDASVWGTKFYEYTIQAPTGLGEMDKPVLIASTTYETEILQQLRDMGIAEERLVTYSSLLEQVALEKP